MEQDNKPIVRITTSKPYFCCDIYTPERPPVTLPISKEGFASIWQY